MTKRVIEVLALGRDEAEFQHALLVATPEQREAAAVLVDLAIRHHLLDKDYGTARMDQLLKSDPRLADGIGRDDGDTA